MSNNYDPDRQAKVGYSPHERDNVTRLANPAQIVNEARKSIGGRINPSALHEICNAAITQGMTDEGEIKKQLGPDIAKLIKSGKNPNPNQTREILRFISALNVA